MNSSTYNQLSIFLAIAQTGGIRQAARKLEMAPPSVSQALKRLEATLGLPLITRTTRHMELTDAGRLLFEKAAPLVAELDQTLSEINELSQVPSGKLRLTIPHFAFHHLLQPVYADFCRRYPEIELELSVADATINLIQEGFDAGIRMAHQVEEGMVSVPLTPPVKLALVASPDYLQTHGIPREPQDLSHHYSIRYRFISANQLAPIRLEVAGEEIMVEGRTAMIVNHPDVMLDATAKGMGIGVMLYPMMREYLEAGSLVRVLPDYWATLSSLHLYFPQHSQKARRIRVLIDFLREHAVSEW
ncbi:MAG: LysR family transcriptional regulator [Gammaproteobacteria bacterium]|nr:MAG: LysR family transcriptional regulator [Gammaproteobacteria bacterium]